MLNYSPNFFLSLKLKKKKLEGVKDRITGTIN